jgi:hypothetical protein
MAAEQMPWLTALTALRPVDDPAFHTLAQTGVGTEMSGGESKQMLRLMREANLLRQPKRFVVTTTRSTLLSN